MSPEIVSILALVVIEEEPALAGIAEIFVVVTVTVLMSVFAHGLTAASLTRRYGRASVPPARARVVGELPSLLPGLCSPARVA